jgi:hemin uptake protein HemP
VTESAQDARPARPAGAPVPAVARVASSELFRGEREIVILHRGQEYRLHITKADKLILTK